MVNESGNKVFRAKKTHQNRDDFKVLIVGLMFSIILLLSLPMVGKVYDSNWQTRPFVSATLEVIQTEHYERPMILYDADAVVLVSAIWIAIVRDDKGNRLYTRKGLGNYSSKEDNPRLWTWTAFFDNGTSVPPPIVSQKPFMVCVRYISTTLNTEVTDESPEFCSKVFYPNRKPISETIVEGRQ